MARLLLWIVVPFMLLASAPAALAMVARVNMAATGVHLRLEGSFAPLVPSGARHHADRIAQIQAYMPRLIDAMAPSVDGRALHFTVLQVDRGRRAGEHVVSLHAPNSDAAREFGLTWPAGYGDLEVIQLGVDQPYGAVLRGGMRARVFAAGGPPLDRASALKSGASRAVETWRHKTLGSDGAPLTHGSDGAPQTQSDQAVVLLGLAMVVLVLGARRWRVLWAQVAFFLAAQAVGCVIVWTIPVALPAGTALPLASAFLGVLAVLGAMSDRGAVLRPIALFGLGVVLGAWWSVSVPSGYEGAGYVAAIAGAQIVATLAAAALLAPVRLLNYSGARWRGIARWGYIIVALVAVMMAVLAGPALIVPCLVGGAVTSLCAAALSPPSGHGLFRRRVVRPVNAGVAVACAYLAVLG